MTQSTSGLRQNCTMPNCTGKCIAIGYCWKHYRRWLRHGDPNIVHRREAITAAPAMIHAYESGLTIDGVAKHFGLGREQVGGALRRAGVTRVLPLDERKFCRNGHELEVVGIYRSLNGDASRCKACRKAQVHKWQEANRERVRAYSRAYYRTNRNKLLTYGRAYSRKRVDAHRVRPWQSRSRLIAKQ